MKRLLIVATLLLLWVGIASAQYRARYAPPVFATDIVYSNGTTISPNKYPHGGSFQGELTWIGSTARDGEMGVATNTNRRVLFVTPGHYDIGADLTLPAYVDLIGIGGTSAVYLHVGSTYDILNSASSETGTAVTNLISGMTIDAGKCILNNTGANLCRMQIKNCHLIASEVCVYTGALSNKQVSLWDCILDTNQDGIKVAGAANMVSAYNCSITSTVATDGGVWGVGACLFGASTNITTSIINLYQCDVAVTSNQSGSASTNIAATAIGVGNIGNGIINMYGGSISATAVAKGSYTATAHALEAETTTTGTVNAYGISVITSASGSSDLSAMDYYNEGLGNINLYQSFGDFSKTYSTDTSPILVQPTIRSCVNCTAATNMANYPNGIMFTNFGDTDGVAFTAPAAVIGARFSVVDVVDTATCDITITCTGSDHFVSPTDGSTEYTVYTHTIDKWAIVSFECFTTAHWQMVEGAGAES